MYPFTMKGRFSRAEFFMAMMCLRLIFFFLDNGISYLLKQWIPQNEYDDSTYQLCLSISLCMTIFLAVLFAFQVVRRLHDLDRPGTDLFLLLVPFYNLYLMAVFLLKKGTPGPNRYGDDPLLNEVP